MDTLANWLQRHDLTIDLITIATVVVCAYIIAAGLFVAAWTLLGTHDQTAVGRTLKWQKFALAGAFFVNGIYWTVVLTAYFAGYIVGVWEKIALRLVFSGGMLVGAVFVFLFVRALRSQIGVTEYGSAPLAGPQDD